MVNLEMEKPGGVITRVVVVEEIEELAKGMGLVATLGEAHAVRATLEMFSLPLEGGSEESKLIQ